MSGPIPKPFTLTDTNRMQVFADSLRHDTDHQLEAWRRRYARKAGVSREYAEKLELVLAEMKRREDEQSGQAA